MINSGFHRPADRVVINLAPAELPKQAAAFLTGELEIEATPSRMNDLFEEFSNYDFDFADVRGQEMAKRAITVAAAGNHNLLIV